MAQGRKLKKEERLTEAALAFEKATQYAPVGSTEARDEAVLCRTIHELNRQYDKAMKDSEGHRLAKRWPEAKAALVRALQLRPNDKAALAALVVIEKSIPPPENTPAN